MLAQFRGRRFFNALKISSIPYQEKLVQGVAFSSLLADAITKAVSLFEDIVLVSYGGNFLKFVKTYPHNMIFTPKNMTLTASCLMLVRASKRSPTKESLCPLPMPPLCKRTSSNSLKPSSNQVTSNHDPVKKSHDRLGDFLTIPFLNRFLFTLKVFTSTCFQRKIRA